MSLEELQKKWNCKNVSIVKGEGGLTKVVLTNRQSSLEVYLMGATITAYKVGSRDVIFTSKQSKFESLKAIRGGVPLIYPQFGPGKMQQHGFARNVDWEVLSTLVKEQEDLVQLNLSIHESEYTQKVCGDADIKFQCTFTIKLNVDRLELQYESKNTGQKAYDFQLALHTYYQIASIHKAHVTGLKGFEYIDKTRQMALTKETADSIQITEETDRVYKNCTTSPLELVDTVNQTKVILHSPDNSLKDVVVWNPWIEKAKAMSDFGDLEYLEMICIEYGNIDKPIVLQPGQTFTGRHTIQPTSIQQSSL
ncbi:aldose 1-epimerase family protein [Tieghemostelium lacteum]|uniref:glucose-6-phosphate 1-epimerase n=1 Tax=Tieghemostelium lacteum TaxID=361077 RepID=A0A152A6Q0_TIELA|nr:aldose 1-epimerase family protein [Tieghemostelium lacteum]|eukprot:KYR01747.1 aldose 1-epimerase family protein [Tieghemostelium lacteum]